MNIIFFGTPEIAANALKTISNNKKIKIQAVVTQTDKTVGRKQKIEFSPVKKTAINLKIPLIQPENKIDLYEKLKNFDTDMFVVIAFGMILNKKILDLPKISSINVHGSILPKYRGASPIQEALLNGDKETGISIIKMDEKMDHGPVYITKKVKIDIQDDFQSLFSKISDITSKVLPEVIEKIFNNSLKPIHQNEKNATYCKKIDKKDGEINWNSSSDAILNKIRAYSLWPNCYTKIDGKILKILKAEKSNVKSIPGIMRIEDDKIKIGTNNGSIVPTVIQLEGKKIMNIKEFLNGYKNLIQNYLQKNA